MPQCNHVEELRHRELHSLYRSIEIQLYLEVKWAFKEDTTRYSGSKDACFRVRCGTLNSNQS